MTFEGLRSGTEAETGEAVPRVTDEVSVPSESRWPTVQRVYGSLYVSCLLGEGGRRRTDGRTCVVDVLEVAVGKS